MKVKWIPVVVSALLGACGTSRTAQPPPSAQAQPSSPRTPELTSTLLFEVLNQKRGDERQDVRMQTTQWEQVPRILRTVTLPVSTQTTPHRVTLAGDAAATKPITVDNFILFEVFDEQEHRIASAIVGNVVGCSGPALLDGSPIAEVGPKAFRIDAGAVDLSPLLPTGRPFVLRATALDYGGDAYVSDVYLIVS